MPSVRHLSSFQTLLKADLGDLTAKPVGQRATQQLRGHVAIQECRLDNALRMEHSGHVTSVSVAKQRPQFADRLACSPGDHPNSWAIGMIATLRQILSMLHRSKASAVGAITVRSVVPVASNTQVLNLAELGELQSSGHQHGLAQWVVKCQLVLDNRQDFHQEREQRTAEPLAAIPFEPSWCGGTLCPATTEPGQCALETALLGQGVPCSHAPC